MAEGLVIASNEAIESFLQSAASDDYDNYLCPELRELASLLSSWSAVSYRSMQSIWFALPAAERPSLGRLFDGANFIFSGPKPRVKSEELKARLKVIVETAEIMEYAELVKDIAPKKNSEPFSSYKGQIGFGVHVVLIMFTGYLVGFAAFRAMFNHSTVMNAAGGIFGLICGMLLEVVLFIIRTSDQDATSASLTSRPKKN